MKRDAKYWAERFKLIEQAEHNRGTAAVSDIEKQYREAQRQLEAKLDAWYRRFADNNQVSMTEAKKMLAGRDLKEFKWDVHEYIRYGEENALNGQWVKELENASARVHISRLEAMKIQMQQQVEVLFGGQLDSIDSAMRDIYLDGYYRTAYEVHKGVGFGWDFGTLDQRRIDKVINKPWAQDGRNFSDRVWSNKQKLVGELNTTLTQNIVLGQDPQKAIDVMAKRLNVSKNTAGRLVMTEQAAFCSAAQHDCFKDLDVDEYEIVATLDSHTSEICQEMDGKHFKMSEWETGITAPPFHVWCRSTTVPYFEDDFGEPGERAARGADGKTYMVPANTTYKEWSKAFVQGNKSGLKEVKQEIKLTDKEIDAKILDLRKQQRDLSQWGTYDEIVKDFGSIDDYFDEDDADRKAKFLGLQNQIVDLGKQRSTPPPVIQNMGGVDVTVEKKQFGFCAGGDPVKQKAAVIYTTPDGTKFVFPERFNKQHQQMTPEKAIELWHKVPEAIRKKSQKTIEFVDYYNPRDSHWKKVYKNFTQSYATGGSEITFYRWDYPHDEGYVIRTYCHEGGHFIDQSMQNSSGVWYSDDSEWTQAMTDDKIKSGKKSVTTYGENSNHEDFAESCAEYIKDAAMFKKTFPHRAKLLQKIFT